MGRPYFIAMLSTLPKTENRFDFVSILTPGTGLVTALMPGRDAIDYKYGTKSQGVPFA
jgi:hypothetical protein